MNLSKKAFWEFVQLFSRFMQYKKKNKLTVVCVAGQDLMFNVKKLATTINLRDFFRGFLLPFNKAFAAMPPYNSVLFNFKVKSSSTCNAQKSSL